MHRVGSFEGPTSLLGILIHAFRAGGVTLVSVCLEGDLRGAARRPGDGTRDQLALSILCGGDRRAVESVMTRFRQECGTGVVLKFPDDHRDQVD